MNKRKYFFIIILLYALPIFGQNFVNGNFEQGPNSGWNVYSSNGAGIIGTAAFFYSTSITPSVNPRSGNYMARIGGFGYAVNSISQVVTLPTTSKVYLVSYYQDRASTGSECSGLFAGAEVKIIISGTTVHSEYLCYYNTVNNWTLAYLDLTTIAGKTVEITFKADAANSVWSYLYLDDIAITSSLTDIEDADLVPVKYKLNQNFPNPFNPETVIQYQLASTSFVSLKIYDVLGNEVSTLVNETKTPGTHQIIFNASNLPSGIYMYRLNAGSFSSTKKLVLIR